MIFIYDDLVHNNAGLMIALQTVCPDVPLRLCTSSMILNGCLSDARTLIMPGGADLFYCEKLDGFGNQIIKNFVADGGSYLGICAGAYYACTTIDWNREEIAGPRELQFYNRTATGPVFEWIANQCEIYQAPWTAAACIQTNDGEEFLTLYNGGPVFSEPLDDTVSVLARYKDLSKQPPAVLEGSYGNGGFVLASPHLEIFGHALLDGLYTLSNSHYERERTTVKNLLPWREKQETYFSTIIKKLYEQAS